MHRSLEIIEDEITKCLGLLGVTKLGELDESYLHMDAPTVSQPHIFNSFLLLNLEDSGY